MKDGKAVEIDVSPDGRIHEVETAIATSDVPAAVMKIIEPTFRVSSLRSSNEPARHYEFEGKVNGREVDVEVNASGTEIIIADDAASEIRSLRALVEAPSNPAAGALRAEWLVSSPRASKEER